MRILAGELSRAWHITCQIVITQLIVLVIAGTVIFITIIFGIAQLLAIFTPKIYPFQQNQKHPFLGKPDPSTGFWTICGHPT